MKTILCSLCAILLCGCAITKDKVLVGTSTVLGFELAQNPATQLYQLRFGYGRAEIALVPTNGLDVLTEIQFQNVTGQGGLYQRTAVGATAVKQSMFMFARDATGKLDPQTADTVSRAMATIPPNNASGTATKVPIAEAYRLAADKTKYDAVAQTLGYLSYEAFLLNTSVTSDQVQTMRAALKTAGVPVP